ncbi:MAG: hypothetical protein QNJ70_12580 [Xenococcaceae cyanobacterium MO_207.B15]|nr:hypothetical protein [Xenococcaceae cyanobacterium MO_207.B15]
MDAVPFYEMPMEALSAAVLSILALTLPLLAMGLVIGLLMFAIVKIIKFFPSLMGKIKGK